MDQCRTVLQNSVAECKSNWIALSGGLDSSILAYLLKESKTTRQLSIITKDFLGTDLTYCTNYCQTYHNYLFHYCKLSLEEVLDSINETIRDFKKF